MIRRLAAWFDRWCEARADVWRHRAAGRKETMFKIIRAAAVTVVLIVGLSPPAHASTDSEVWAKASATLVCWVTPEWPKKAATQPVTVRGSGPVQCNHAPTNYQVSVWQIQRRVVGGGMWIDQGIPTISYAQAAWLYKTDTTTCSPGTYDWRLKMTVEASDVSGPRVTDDAYSVAVRFTC